MFGMKVAHVLDMEKSNKQNKAEASMLRLYFAYGSNMDPKQMARRCPSSTIVGKARLKGYRFQINQRGVATIVPDSNSIVWGLAWQISERDEKSLDDAEGVRYGTYLKQCAPIEFEDGNSKQLLVYIASNSDFGTPRENYLEGIVTVAESNGFPDDYLSELKKMARGRRVS